MRRALRTLLALALLLPLAAQAAQAQLPTCNNGQTLGAGLDRASAELQPGETAVFNLTVSNDGSLDGTASVDLSEAGGGWAASVVPRSQDIAAGQKFTFAVSATAPSQAGAPRSLVLSATATLACSVVPGVSGGTATSDPQRITLAIPPAPPAPTLSEQVPAIALLLLAIVALAAAAGAAALFRRRGPLRLSSPEARRDLPPGGGASFPLRLENVSAARQQVQLRIADLPEGWRALQPPGEVALDPGEGKNLQILVRPPPEAMPPAGARFRVEARAVGQQGPPVHVTLEAFVVDASATAPAAAPGGPGPAPGRPDVVVRSEESLADEGR